MGFTKATITIGNMFDIIEANEGKLSKSSVRQVQVESLVDSGAFTLTINEKIRQQLGLKLMFRRPSYLADGTRLMLDIVGPVEVKFANRSAMVEAAVVPDADEVLLGVVPLELLDVLIDPCQNQLVVNPAHPDEAVMRLKLRT